MTASIGIALEPLMALPKRAYVFLWMHDITHSTSQLRILSILSERDEMAANRVR